ncbi:MAG: hypothetical protein QOH06_1922 [Acidobacteriota bacterium]|jgi:uncharacterized RDD family membrane protein YckC|nr:hypothetical protein [Acidobacteriota bacterium]
MPCKNHPLVEDRLACCSRCAEAFCPDCIVEIGGLPHCLICKAESMRDLHSGVAFRGLDLASFGRRFAAILIDGLLVALPILVPVALVFLLLSLANAQERMLEILASEDSIFPAGFLTLGGGLLYFLYEGLMLASGGQTMGKRAMRVKVVTVEGGDITAGQAWSRAILRTILAFVPGLGLIDLLAAFGLERASLHDRLARTRVVNWE